MAPKKLENNFLVSTLGKLLVNLCNSSVHPQQNYYNWCCCYTVFIFKATCFGILPSSGQRIKLFIKLTEIEHIYANHSSDRYLISTTTPVILILMLFDGGITQIVKLTQRDGNTPY
jgi:hypothetical protein